MWSLLELLGLRQRIQEFLELLELFFCGKHITCTHIQRGDVLGFSSFSGSGLSHLSVWLFYQRKSAVAPTPWVALGLCYVTAFVKHHTDAGTVVIYEHVPCLLSSTISSFLYKVCHMMVDTMDKSKPGTRCWDILLLSSRT